MTGRSVGAVTTAIAAAALILAGCGSDAQSLAHEACTHVNRSLALYAAATRDPAGPRAADERKEATAELETALPLAARANSADPMWNPLMTTLQESGNNSEGNLVTALRSQCAVADSSAASTGGTTPVPG